MGNSTDYLQHQGDLFVNTDSFIEKLLAEVPDILSNRERLIRAILHEDAACLLVDYPQIQSNHYWDILSGYFKILLDDQFITHFLYQATNQNSIPFCLDDVVYEVIPKPMEYYIASYYGPDYVDAQNRRDSFLGRLQFKLKDRNLFAGLNEDVRLFISFSSDFFGTASFLSPQEEEQAMNSLIEQFVANPVLFRSKQTIISIPVGQRILKL